MWKTRSISTRTKNLYSAFVTPILVYGSRCWYLRKEDGRRILEAAMSWLRRIAGSIRTNRIRNEITWKVLEQRGTLFDRIRKKKIDMIRYVKRMDDEQLPTKTLYCHVETRWMGHVAVEDKPRHRWITGEKTCTKRPC